MTWAINCVLVFSIAGLLFAVTTFRNGRLPYVYIETLRGRHVKKSDAVQLGVALCGFVFFANILIIIAAKLGW